MHQKLGKIVGLEWDRHQTIFNTWVRTILFDVWSPVDVGTKSAGSKKRRPGRAKRISVDEMNKLMLTMLIMKYSKYLATKMCKRAARKSKEVARV